MKINFWLGFAFFLSHCGTSQNNYRQKLPSADAESAKGGVTVLSESEEVPQPRILLPQNTVPGSVFVDVFPAESKDIEELFSKVDVDASAYGITPSSDPFNVLPSEEINPSGNFEVWIPIDDQESSLNLQFDEVPNPYLVLAQLKDYETGETFLDLFTDVTFENNGIKFNSGYFGWFQVIRFSFEAILNSSKDESFFEDKEDLLSD